jgi:hypothetical protein
MAIFETPKRDKKEVSTKTFEKNSGNENWSRKEKENSKSAGSDNGNPHIEAVPTSPTLRTKNSAVPMTSSKIFLPTVPTARTRPPATSSTGSSAVEIFPSAENESLDYFLSPLSDVTIEKIFNSTSDDRKRLAGSSGNWEEEPETEVADFDDGREMKFPVKTAGVKVIILFFICHEQIGRKS